MIEYLRQHFQDTLKKYGHKVIYRRYSVGERSDYYNKATHEGVGGSRWKYTDSVIITRNSPVSTRGSRGEFIGKTIYFLKHDTNPKVNDVIIEVSGDVSPQTPDGAILTAPHKQVFRIVDIEIKRGMKGEIVFYTCYARPEYGYY